MVLAGLFVAAWLAFFPQSEAAGTAGLRPQVGPDLQHPGLGTLLPLPVLVLPAELLGDEYYRSSEDLYYRYPPEMRIPVYNKGWHNYYPAGRSFQNGRMFHREMGLKYHRGHHFVLDVF